MKVAIIGTVPASRGLAPYDDNTWKIWACSPGNRTGLPRIDVWYELHGVVDLKSPRNADWSKDYFDWLKSQSFLVYMQEPNDLVPGARVFPMRRLVERFGRRWFTSSIAWMMAHALDQMVPEGSKAQPGEHEIGLFGIDMAHADERYTHQRAGCQRFMEIATDLGVAVNVPLESCLGREAPLYGYAEATAMGLKLVTRREEMRRNIANIDAQIARLQNERTYFAGAMEENTYIANTFVDGTDAILDEEPQPQPGDPVSEFKPHGLLVVPKAAEGF